jgi:hypothetical protein
MKISNAPAMKREAEEESFKKKGENHDLGARGPFCLTLQKGGCLGPLQTDVEVILESARATAIIEPTSPRGYGAGATLIMGVVAPVIMAVLAVPRIMFFNV